MTTRRDLEDIVRGLDERVRPAEPESSLLAQLYGELKRIYVAGVVGDGGSCRAPTPFLASVAITEVQVRLFDCDTGLLLLIGTRVTFEFTGKPGVVEIKSDADIQSITILVDGYRPREITFWQILTFSVPAPPPVMVVTVKVIFLGEVCLEREK